MPGPRSWRLWERHRPILLVAVGALIVALVLAVVLISTRQSETEEIADRFAEAWERSDYRAMHSLLTPQRRRDLSAEELARRYESAHATATTTSISFDEPEDADEGVRLPASASTRVFGRVGGDVLLPVGEAGVDWEGHLVFPALRPGERLRRRTEAPRAAILDRHGDAIVSGPAHSRRIREEAAESIAGELGPPQSVEQRQETYARGFPLETPVGLFGLESMLELQVAGRPGGVLLADERTIARSEPRASRAIRSTIDSDLQAASDAALGARFGGIAALDARTGEVRALSGIAFSGPQPPGSTFKIVTATAALERDLVEPSSRFPVERRAAIGGEVIENADGERCGGTFVASFAHSCNSVFAPLGVRLGAEALVETAERYGFNEPPRIRGAKPSTLPQGQEIDSDFALGATAIGQGRVLATPLQLASVSQAVASGGRRHEPSVLAEGPRPASREVTSPAIASALERMMVAVVERGTGRRAALRGVEVAAKTGTAELERTTDEGDGGRKLGERDDPSDTDAWLAAYAPVGRPTLAVAVMLVEQGQGGETAAPVARRVLRAGAR